MPGSPSRLSPSVCRALIAAGAFASGVAAGACGRDSLLASLPPLGVLAATLPRGRRERRARRFAFCLFWIAAGMAAAGFDALRDPLPPLLARWRDEGIVPGSTPLEITGRVRSVRPLDPDRREIVIAVDSWRAPRSPCGRATRRIGARLTLSAPRDGAPIGEAIRPGDRLALTARLGPPRTFRNPGGFDYRAWLAARGIALAGTIKSPRLVQVVRRPAAPDVLPRAREWIVGTLRRAAGAEIRTGAFLAALLVGEREDLPPDLEEDLLAAGVYHIVALSGLNVGLVAGLAALLLRPTRAVRTRRVLAAACVAGYWALAHESGSMTRATVMAVLYLIGAASGRPVAGLSALSVTVVLVLAARPAWIADPGFHLSCAATVGILLLGNPPRPARGALARARAWLRASFAVSLAALAGTALVGAHHFHTLTPAALLGNLVAVPIAAVLLLAAIGIVAASGWLPGVGALLACGADAAIALLAACASALSGPAWLSFFVRPPGPATVLWGLLALIVSGAGPRRRLAGMTLLATLVAGVAAMGRAPRADGRLQVTVLDVGQGDALFLRLPDGFTILVDAGGLARSSFDIGARVVGPAVRAMGTLKIDVLVLTHAHRDHLGGAASVLRTLRPDAIWSGRLPRGDPAALAIEALAEARGVPIVLPRRGVGLRVGGVRVEVLNPAGSSSAISARNDDSLVLRLVHGTRAVVLAADMEAPEERALVGEGRALSADLLKVGHHGSRTSTTLEFLRAVRPAVAAISAGAANPWGHPDPVVLERLAAAGAVVHRTDLDGAVEFSTDGRASWRARVIGSEALRRGAQITTTP